MWHQWSEKINHFRSENGLDGVLVSTRVSEILDEYLERYKPGFVVQEEEVKSYLALNGIRDEEMKCCISGECIEDVWKAEVGNRYKYVGIGIVEEKKMVLVYFVKPVVVGLLKDVKDKGGANLGLPDWMSGDVHVVYDDNGKVGDVVVTEVKIGMENENMENGWERVALGVLEQPEVRCFLVFKKEKLKDGGVGVTGFRIVDSGSIQIAKDKSVELLVGKYTWRDVEGKVTNDIVDEEELDEFQQEDGDTFVAGFEADKLTKAIQETKQRKAELNRQNAEMQKMIIPLMQRTHDSKDAPIDKMNEMENEKRYADTVKSVGESSEQLKRAQAQYDRIAMDLQSRLDEKEYKATEIQESFMEFKREIAKGAENSRTGKAIPQRVIAQFEAAEKSKDREVEKVRLKNINLRTHLKKLEQHLRAKEQLAEGLHLIDFEQLKIENQTLNEKIEERNEELHKLRKKTTETVQVLTHIKEKLQFVHVENQTLKKNLEGIEDELTNQRNHLTKTKQERDATRASNAELRRKQGFANSGKLVDDFEKRNSDLEQLENRKSEMIRKLAYLQEASKKHARMKKKQIQ